MTASIKDIYDFIETATRNRKYPVSTANGLRAAVKLFDSELNDEERKSLATVKSNVEQIYQSVFTKNKSFTAASLATYKSRFLKVINDYEKYGTDPTKMTNWNPKVISRVKKTSAKADPSNNQTDEKPNSPENFTETIPSNMHKIELALRPDAKFILIIPRDLKKTEATTLNAILASLVVDGSGDESSRLQEAPSE